MDASYVMADRDRLMQVMLNLLSNAEKFIPQGSGRIDVSLRREHNLYRVSIADNGPGIPPAAQAVIFEKFRQVGDIGANPMGTGLGLPISREIIEHFGGHITVHSSPGDGAIFIFELPCKDQTASTDTLEEKP
jgi:signal transduction histidine kinase